MFAIDVLRCIWITADLICCFIRLKRRSSVCGWIATIRIKKRQDNKKWRTHNRSMNVWRCKRWAGENGEEMEQNQQTPRLRRVRHNTQRLYGAKRFDSNRMVTGTVVRFFEYLVNILFIDMVYSVSWNTSLPAGWSFIAVGPSRFHVMFGFGEPFFPDATTRQQPTSQRADSNRTESELKENRTKRDTEKYIFEKEVEEDRKKTEIICKWTFIGAEKW